jgi:GNAT superfamily N-acetyltransferase
MQWVDGPLDSEHWTTVRDLRLASLRDDPDAFGATLEEEGHWSEGQWRDFIARQAVFALHDHEGPAGIALVETLDGDFGATCWLGGCWVSPRARRRGLLRHFLSRLDAEAATRGWQVQGLGVWENNHNAIAAYEALGFALVGDAVVSTRRPPRRYVRMIRRSPDL